MQHPFATFAGISVFVFCLAGNPIPPARADVDAWSPERILALLKAREEALPTIDVLIVGEEGPSPLWAEYVAASKESNRALDRALRDFNRTDPPEFAEAHPTQFRRLVRDSRGRIRHEHLKSAQLGENNVSHTIVFDGNRWLAWDAIYNRGVIQHASSGSKKERPGEVLGIDLTWRRGNPGRHVKHSLHAVCEDWRRSGFWHSTDTDTGVEGRELVRVEFRRHSDNPRAVERGLFEQLVLWLDPQFGLAPVRSEERSGLLLDGALHTGGGGLSQGNCTSQTHADFAISHASI